MDEITATDLHGRLGTIFLPKGNVTTPTLIPVVDPKRNIIQLKEMHKKFGFNFVITSAYLFYKKYGMPDSTQKIHEILDFDGNIMMDSGAYQILAYGDVDIDPIKSLEIQSNLGADVGVILDVPTPPRDTYQQSKIKMEETINRIEISKEHISNHPETIWTLPIQGGKNVELIEEYIQKVKEREYLNLFGFQALGSVAPIMSQYDYLSLFSMIQKSRSLLPHNVPFHLFGAGHPMIFPFIVALGCDTFDSAAYILYARENRYMTSMETYHLSDLNELPCSCEVCSSWSPKELLETNEETRIEKISLHNLCVSHAELKKIRVSLREGRLWELIEQRAKAHPYLFKAFKYCIENFNHEYWEFVTPITKQTGLKIYDESSFYRPEFTKSRRRILSNYKPYSNKLCILTTSGKKNPLEFFNSNRKVKEIVATDIEEIDYTIYLPFFGLIPIELIETYPFSQYVFSGSISDNLIEKANSIAVDFIKKMNYQEIVIYSVDMDEQSELLSSTIKEVLGNQIKEIKIANIKYLTS